MSFICNNFNENVEIQSLTEADFYRGLARLLERVGCLNLKVNFQNIFLIYLWVLLCFKVGDNSANIYLLGAILAYIDGSRAVVV